MEELRLIIQQLEKRIEELTHKNEHLEAMLLEAYAQIAAQKVKKTSSNSSIPPSHDLRRKNKSLREKSDKKSGGQKGHKGTTLTFTGTPDEVEEIRPNFCQGCGADISEKEPDKVVSNYLVDVVIRRKVTQQNQYQVTCTCGKVHRPERKPNIQYGTVASALITYLNTQHYLSFKRITDLMKEVAGIPISQGTVANKLKEAGKNAEKAVEFIRKEIEKSAVVGADETGISHNGKKHWFWVFQTSRHTLIHSAQSRGKSVINQLFPDGLPNSILVSDRYAAYQNLVTRGRQVCLAHLLREAIYCVEVEKTDWAKQVVQWCRDCFSSEIDLKELPARLVRLLTETVSHDTRETKKLYNALQKNAPWMTTFVHHEEVPPDNNASERAIRHVKCKAKICGQFKTEIGSQIYAYLHSLVDTARKNGQNIFNVFKSLAQNFAHA